MKRVMALAGILIGCVKPPPPPPVVVPPPPVAAKPTAPPLAYEGRCADGESQKLDATWTISVDECDQKGADDESWPRVAYLVRRLTPTTGYAWELDTWTQHREGGKNWTIEGVLRDRAGAATKVLLVSREGGLDQAAEAHLSIYDVATDRIDHTKISAETIDVEVAPDATMATVTSCSSEAMYIDLEHPLACKDEPTAKVNVVEIR